MPREVRKTVISSSAILSYGITILSVAAALIFAISMQNAAGRESTPIVALYLCAIAFSTWFGGIGPGFFAIVLSLLSFEYYFVPPIYSLADEIKEIPRLIIFMLAAFFVGSLSVAQRRSAESLRRARDILNGTIEELKETNDALLVENTERKQAEVALRGQKEILQKIVDHIPVMINFTDKEGQITLVNREWERTLGWSLDEIQDENIDVFAMSYPDPKYRQEVMEFVQAAGGEWKDFKTRTRDGSIIDTNWARVRLSDGTTIGIGRDITKRKQAEEALQRSEDRLRLVIDTTPIMSWTVRPDGVVDFLSQRWMDYTGLPLEPYVEDPTGPIHPDDSPRAIEKWLAAKAVGEQYDDEMRLRGANGKYRWFLVRTAPLKDELGNVVKWYGVSIDIEDRQQAEEKLRKSESQLAEAQRLAHIGSWDWDVRTNAVNWSAELYHIFGLPPGTINVAGQVDRFIHPDDLDLGWDIVKRAVASNEPYDYYHRILRPDGTERIARSRGAIMCDERGDPIKVFGATQDVTELKRAEEQLKATTKQLRALSARVQSAREEEGTRIAREIHDELGATLSSLRWDLEELDEGISASRDQSKLSEVRKKIEAMMRLTDTTMDTVRRIASELRPIALDSLGLAEAIELHANQFQARTAIVVEYDHSGNNVNLTGVQSTAVFRIFQEALTNILRHAQATTINIMIGEQDGEFILSISDNGRGITDNEISGTGTLGILGMEERANLIGGRIEIARAKGTVVTVRIPISS